MTDREQTFADNGFVAGETKCTDCCEILTSVDESWYMFAKFWHRDKDVCTENKRLKEEADAS